MLHNLLSEIPPQLKHHTLKCSQERLSKNRCH